MRRSGKIKKSVCATRIRYNLSCSRCEFSPICNRRLREILERGGNTDEEEDEEEAEKPKRTRKTWTPEEIAMLADPKYTAEQIANMLGRNKRCVYSWRQSHGMGRGPIGGRPKKKEGQTQP